jgi:adenylyltransferase/sulfurtransferase
VEAFKKLNSLSSNELPRYVRQITLPNIGLDGQQILKAAKVLVIGAGGLASPVLMYLASSGVGHIGIVDADTVDVSNLHRQVIFTEAQQNHSKAKSAKTELTKRNSYTDIKIFETLLTEDNALDIMQGYDVVVDCTDNFATRYVVNDACHTIGIANVFASISQFDGQCSIFCTSSGPCYRCLYTSPPPLGLIPNCAEGGVLGVLPGLLGMIQATEVIKYLLNIGNTLVGRLLTVNTLSMDFNTFPIKKNPSCPLCSGHETFDTVNRKFTTTCNTDITNDTADFITVEELQAELTKNKSAYFILDVREPHEYQIANMEGCLIPLGELATRLSEIDTAKVIVVHCQSGVRSAKAVQLLQASGICAINLKGGMNAWQTFMNNNNKSKP